MPLQGLKLTDIGRIKGMNFQELLLEIELTYNGVPFGSRAWGGFREDSDFDYVMPLSDAMRLKAMMNEIGAGSYQITENVYYVSGYYILETNTGKQINITGCRDDDYKAWSAASEMMKKAPCDTLTKESRQMLFEVILSMLKKTFLNKEPQR